MKRQRQLIATCVTALLLCSAAGEAFAYYEDFESYTNGTPMTAVPNWQSKIGGSGNGDYNVLATSEIDVNNTNTPPINYGAVGYNLTKGLETKFASGGNATLQGGAMVTMTGADIITTSTTSPFFSTQIRLSSYQINGSPSNQFVYQPQGNTDNGIANSFMLYLGTGIKYGSGSTAQKMVLTNASTFVVYFESAKDAVGGLNTIWTETAGTATSSWTPGFGANAAGTNSFNYRLNPSTTWSRDTWYTVELSEISLGVTTTNATSVLNIFESDNPANMLVSNLVIIAQGGSATAWGNTFNQIDQIGFAETRQNGVDQIDNITLIPEPGTAVLCVSGLLGVAMVMRQRRQRRKE